MPKRISLHNGAVVGRYRDGSGEKTVVLVTLPTADWDALTASTKELHRLCTGNPSWPDMSFEERVEQFIELEVLEWQSRLGLPETGISEGADEPF